MDSHPHDLESLNNRLARLESQNHRFKQLAVVGLVGAALLLMGQTPVKKTVEANEFILRDQSGNVRARLSMPDDAMPQMLFLDGKGNPSLELTGGIAGALGSSVGIFDAQGERVGMFFSGLDGGNFWLRPKGPGSSLVMLVPGSVEISDDEGFATEVGVVQLVTSRTSRTGETHKTSAASLVMLDKSKNVIWRAP
jgi:hypothetical protein